MVSNGRIKARVYVPDGKSGIYHSTRFDWSGMIAALPHGRWASVTKKGTMNEWYRLIFSADDLAAARHLELEGHFEKFFLAAGSPEDATLFGGLGPGQTIYYFSPGAARIAMKLINHLAAVPCPAPAMSEVVFIAGHRSS